MRKRILALLLPVLAITPVAMLPETTRAGDLIQSASGEFTAASSNLVTRFGERELKCITSTFHLQESSTNDAQAPISSGSFRGPGGSVHCPTGNESESTIIRTNAATVGWILHTSTSGEGWLQGALADIEFEADIFTIAGQKLIETCYFKAPNGIPVKYSANTLNPPMRVHTGLDFECESGSMGRGRITAEFTSSGGLTIDN